MLEEFTPKIIAFCCNWCAYAGADLAGVSRIQMPSYFRVIRAMCSGRIDERLILKAFVAGADGVLVAGCHPGDCHYQKGNMHARRRVVGLKCFLDAIGVDNKRLRLEWVSAAEGAKFSETIKEFTKTIEELGPSPFRRESYEG